MRLILTALLTLLLAACATQGTQTSGNAAGANATANSQFEVDPSLRKATADQTIDLDHNSVDALAKGQGDLWDRIRNGFQLTDLDGDLVQTQLNWYTSRPDYVQRMTERSQKYLYHIVESLEQRHMPTELALLPFIESAYNPQALSVAKAAGMWQFVPTTGRDYNLKQNLFQDQRRDVLASTNAALDYLSRLHDMFGDWYLALAAYNWGEGNVQRAIARNQAAGLPTDYMSLKLPAETRNYVPKLQAVKDIIANPQMYGLTLPEVPNRPYFVSVKTSHDIDVDVAAQLAELPLDEFKALNPSFRKPLIVGSSDSPILLPFDNAQIFERNLRAHDGPLSSWTTYTVTTRETPAALAQRIGVDADTLVSINKIPAGMRLKSGSTLLVPKTDDSVDDISADVVENAVLSIEPDLPDTRKVLVRVRKRETIAQLALRYNVSIGQIQSWNKTRRTSFTPGQTVFLHLPVDKAVPVEPAAPRLLQAAVEPRASGGRVERLSTVRADVPTGSGSIIKVSDQIDSRAPVRGGKKGVTQGATRGATQATTRGGKAVSVARDTTPAATSARGRTSAANRITRGSSKVASKAAMTKTVAVQAPPEAATKHPAAKAGAKAKAPAVARAATPAKGGKSPVKAAVDTHGKPIANAEKTRKKQDS
jgi:membrane-bound lytic murein transglycosylase D